MKLKELLIVIDRLIDEKLKTSISNNDSIKEIVKEEIKNYINDNLTETVLNNNLIKAEEYNDSAINENADYTNIKPVQKMSNKNVPKTGNKLIDDIFIDIAESGNYIKSDSNMISMKNMYDDNIVNESEYRTLDGNAMLNGRMHQSSINQTKQEFEQMGATPAIANAMIKDYSKILKKSEELSKKMRK